MGDNSCLQEGMECLVKTLIELLRSLNTARGDVQELIHGLGLSEEKTSQFLVMIAQGMADTRDLEIHLARAYISAYLAFHQPQKLAALPHLPNTLNRHTLPQRRKRTVP